MNNVIQHSSAAQYFGTEQQWFWKWAEGVQIIEWSDGKTLIYRDDLIAVLNGISVNGLPHINSVLLILSACRSSRKELKECYTLVRKNIGDWREISLGLEEVRTGIYATEKAFEFLTLITELPEQYKKGTGRIHLLNKLQELFFFSQADAADFLAEFNSGRVDEQITGDTLCKREWVMLPLNRLALLADQFRTVKALELFLETGIGFMPEAVTEQLPESRRDFLNELNSDQETEGISNLTNAILAVFKVPPQSVDNNDQQLGGFADIANRGPLDRLLLSELANDDDLLLARLANNEAMFLRREAPPDNPERSRTLLIDTSLPLWGTPRIFAISAALACIRQNKGISGSDVFTLGGDTINSGEMNTVAGVRNLLTRLHPALNSGVALSRFLNNTKNDQSEIIFITSEELLSDPDFLSYFFPIQSKLNYLICINRSGSFSFFRCSAAGRNELMTASFDLKKLLQPKRSLNQAKAWIKTDDTIIYYQDVMPEFYSGPEFPLLCPATGITDSFRLCLNIDQSQLITITDNHRVLLWDKHGKASRELLGNIEHGDYYSAGKCNLGNLHIIKSIKSSTDFTLTYFSPSLIEVGEEPISANYKGNLIGAKHYKDGQFIILFESLPNKSYSYLVFPEQKSDIKDSLITIYSNLNFVHCRDKFFIAGFIRNPAYKTVRKINRVGVTASGVLKLGHWTLHLSKYNKIVLKNHEHNDSVVVNPINCLISVALRYEWTNLLSTIFTFASGDKIFFDKRGFFHLLSSDASIPSVSGVFVLGVNTALWSSNGNYCGDDYFIPSTGKTVSNAKFYEQYVQPFINRLS